MEKKKTTEEEYDLSYYLGGNEEDTYSKPSKQKDKFIPEREVVRKQEKRTPMNQSGIPSENSEHEQHVVSSQDAVPSQHTENAPVQKRISAKMRKRNARSLQASLPCSDKTEQPKGSLSEPRNAGACRLHRAQVRRQGQQPFKFRGEHCAHSSGGVW